LCHPCPVSKVPEGIRRYHDHNVKERSFNVGDLVLRCIPNMEGLHKLSLISKETGPGSYCLHALESDDISNSWDIDQLC
jgi:hypothetical protein